MRAAIYYTPPAGSALAGAAGEWLGRSAFDGEATREADDSLDDLVASPARYGFHATMKAPFKLAEGVDLIDVDARLAAFCAAREPVVIDPLVVSPLGPFFAFVPGNPTPALEDLAAATVEAFEPYRAPLTEEDIARRSPGKLSERQLGFLKRWGYPYVFEEFRFHMTLTGPVDAKERPATEKRLRERFAEHDGAPVDVDTLALFVEPEPGSPFKVHSLHSFRAA